MSHLIFRGTDRAFVLGLFLIFAASFPIELRAANQATLKIQDSTIHVEFSSEPTEELRPLLLGWIARSARAVAIYYGQFPVKFLEIRVNLKEGRRITSGQTLGWNGPLIKISAGLGSTASTFSDDWEMTHEMTHLAFPGVASSHHWIEEGSATYVEPVARARAGDLTPEKVWADMLKGMRNGLPQSGDRGLDFTPTWGRTYWGGALFCLMADIEIHRRTKNLKGLDDALRAILKAGGNITRDWDLDRALDTGDRATGVTVLREMYDEWKASPVMVDLNELWKSLGVIRDGKAIRFDDSAPRASIRRAITAPNRTP